MGCSSAGRGTGSGTRPGLTGDRWRPSLLFALNYNNPRAARRGDPSHLVAGAPGRQCGGVSVPWCISAGGASAPRDVSAVGCRCRGRERGRRGSGAVERRGGRHTDRRAAGRGGDSSARSTTTPCSRTGPWTRAPRSSPPRASGSGREAARPPRPLRTHRRRDKGVQRAGDRVREAAGNEIETTAHEEVAEEFRLIATAHGYLDADPERLVSARDW
ncbi:DUF5713 family protein [Streptomyces gougerotii]|uniref:DUF5713 family protein n=1 Tax=Streptomyces diastaticus group TaxID=2849069 RepID=UPI003868689F